MDHYRSSLFLLSLFLFLLLSSADPIEIGGEPSALEVDERLEQLRVKQVPDWTPADVAYWVNATLGYGEYSGIMLKHLVDGPALLRLTADDIEEGLPLSSPLHRVKILAHIDLLRGNCACSPVAGAAPVGDSLVSLLYAHNRRMCVEGGTSLVFPRFTFVLTYIFDYEAYVAFVGAEELPPSLAFQPPLSRLALSQAPTTAAPTTLNALLYWTTMMLVPDLVLLCKVAWYLSTNWFLSPLLLLHTATQAYNEFFLFYMIFVLKKPLFDVGTTWRQRVWQLWGWSMLTPVIATVLSFLPVFVVYLALIGLGVYGLLFVVGMLFVAGRGEEKKQE